MALWDSSVSFLFIFSVRRSQVRTISTILSVCEYMDSQVRCSSETKHRDLHLHTPDYSKYPVLTNSFILCNFQILYIFMNGVIFTDIGLIY